LRAGTSRPRFAFFELAPFIREVSMKARLDPYAVAPDAVKAMLDL